ncbi:DegT/DnrJ/EryC1/StrS family aminotransferase [Vagococcus carniphilus]|uniref:DegT/DnrJ/EryC1/StrS family aminotransferase n=1 Tax=Vagococcus carniphilus TaxID=218144 RepID=UPI003B596AA7
MAQYGVSSNVHYKPLPLLRAYKNLGFDIIEYPNANKMFENEITLPLNSLMSLEDVVYTCKTLTKILGDI